MAILVAKARQPTWSVGRSGAEHERRCAAAGRSSLYSERRPPAIPTGERLRLSGGAKV